MKTMILVGMAILLPAVVRGGSDPTPAGTQPGTNATAIPQGWLQLPSRELILNVRHQSLEYGARPDAGEFLVAVLNVLLQANYTVRLSDDFMLDEINYYRANLSREAPAELSEGILACLEKARASGVLDWKSFQQISSTDMIASRRHLPWMSPPFKAKAIRLGGADATNFACLHLSLKWAGRAYSGGVQFLRRPERQPGDLRLLEGQGTLWAFAAVMRLEKGSQTLFEKSYPQDEWQRTYVDLYERPVVKATQAILQDLMIGLKAKTGASSRARAIPPAAPGSLPTAHH
jgi:hypothetical protein